MAGSASSLASAIAGADRRVTVLDDRMDAEDHAAFLWMRAHQLHGYAHHRVVMGTEVLSPGWNAKKMKFLDPLQAESYLHHFDHHHAAMDSLATLAHTLSTAPLKPLSPAEVLTILAASLVNGRAWLIELPAHNLKSRFLAKTDPSAFAPLNPRFGTKVNFAFIASLEGDQWLRGYVPMRKGVVVGRSGMTVASGFDIGQWFPDDLKELHLPPKLMDKIKPFVAPHNFKGMTRTRVVAAVGKLGPVPELTKPEADLCDGAVFGDKLQKAAATWDRTHHAGVPNFTQLPGGWQTVWLSRVYQGKTASFGHLALAGKWQPAIAALRADNQYPERTNREADLLQRELPPAVPAPNAKGAK